MANCSIRTASSRSNFTSSQREASNASLFLKEITLAKILFFNVPSAGHSNATFPIVRELVQRGHEVTYYLTEGYRAPVEAAGARFTAYPDTLVADDFFETHGVNGSNPLKTAASLIHTSRALLPELLASVRAESPDLIVFDSMCAWGWQVAQVLGIPHASSMTLLVMPSSLIASSGMLGRLVSVLLRNIPVLIDFMRGALRLRQEFGLPIPQVDHFLNKQGQITINFTSRSFQPLGDTMPASIKFVGPQLAAAKLVENDLLAQLDGRPLVYVSLGTVINQNVDFFRQALHAFADSPYQVLLSIGSKNDPAALGPLPGNVLVRPFVPQVAVLQRAAAFVTHAGMNSVQESLYFNVPLALVPQQIEQRLVARRVVQLGAGLMSAKPTVPAGELRTMVERLLTEPGFKTQAARIGESLRQAGGTPRAVDELLALLDAQATKKTA